MELSKQIAVLIETISKTYVVDPAVKRITDPQEKLAFAVRHSLLDIQQKIGTIAAGIVPTQFFVIEHSKKIEDALYSIFISTLKMCELLGVSSEQIAEKINAARYDSNTHKQRIVGFRHFLVNIGGAALVLKVNTQGEEIESGDREILKPLLVNCASSIVMMADSCSIPREKFISQAPSYISKNSFL